MEKQSLKQYAQRMDLQDKLSKYRQYYSSSSTSIQSKQIKFYYNQHSLGLMPKACLKNLQQRLFHPWQIIGVDSWFHGEGNWLALQNQLQQLMSPIIGAQNSEIVLMNSLTVNIHLMLTSFYQPTGIRKKILVESKAFPSDQYAVRSFLENLGLNPHEILIQLHSGDHHKPISHKDIIKCIQDNSNQIALIYLGNPNYLTGQVFDMNTITKQGHKIGAIVGFDLAHAVGNIQIKLSQFEVDFAVWCTYKYLSSSPGGIGGAYVNKKHHNKEIKRQAGWWGCRLSQRFKMKDRIDFHEDAQAWSLSCPPVILYIMLKSSLEIIKQIGYQSILCKNRQLIKYTIKLLKQQFCQFESYIEIITPEFDRGNMTSLLFKKYGKQTYNYLTQNNYLVDWRQPGVIRFSFTAQYNRFIDIYQIVHFIKQFIISCQNNNNKQ